MSEVRGDWKVPEVKAIYELPLFELIDRARAVHRTYHGENDVQLATLLSVKTGGCPEDCAYCPQSAHYKTEVQRQGMLETQEVLETAKLAKERGATRFCMGAAWKRVKDGAEFDQIIDMVKGVKELGMEACCTLGTLNEEQAKRLADAGLDAYNHNLDTSPGFYRSIISTRDQSERISTIGAVRRAGVTVCSGGIIGMGESVEDRCALLVELANLSPQPESVPVNALVRAKGTPLEALPPITADELIRMVATARIMMPKSRVRLSAGRSELSKEAQLMALYAGANSIFFGEQLLTTPNPGRDEDLDMIERAGLRVESSSKLSPSL